MGNGKRGSIALRNHSGLIQGQSTGRVYRIGLSQRIEEGFFDIVQWMKVGDSKHDFRLEL